MSCDKCEMNISCPVEDGVACPKVEYQEPLVADNLDHSASECIYCAVIVGMPFLAFLILLICWLFGVIS